MERHRWPVEDIVEHVRSIGVAADDLLMVHASLRAIGPVDGGADGVLDALEAAIGPGGTLFMTLGARDDWAWFNDRPEGDRLDLLRDAQPFDHLVTPADPELGALAEVFRTRSGTMVSDHPEGRFAASGPLAGHLVEDIPWDDYYGPSSPLERFTEANGRVLRLGADLDTLTVLHYAEYLTPLPSKRRTRRHRVVAGRDGIGVRVIDSLDDSEGIADYPGEDYFAAILRRYLATGKAATGLVGAATSELIEADDVVEFAATWMTTHLVTE